MFLELNAWGQSYLSHRKLQVYFFNYSVFAGFGRDLSPSHILNLSGSVDPVRVSTGCRDPKMDKLGLSCSAFIPILPIFCGILQYFFFLQGTVRLHNCMQTEAEGNLDKCHETGSENTK